MRSSMLDAVVANFVDSLTEREFDAPFMALLRAEQYFDVHRTHGSFEFGKDFIAKKYVDGVELQYVFQSKAGNLNLNKWASGLGQVELLRGNRLAHPNFDPSLPRCAVFLTTGRFIGGAALEVQDYCERSTTTGTPLTTWDRENLIERIVAAVNVGLSDRVEAELLTIIGLARRNDLTDGQLEHFTRRWCVDGQDSAACVLEAAIIANALAHIGRVDLASYTGLAMVRATCWQVHGSNPIDAGWETARRLARLIFSTHTDSLIQKLESTELPSAAELIRAHREAAALITHTVRCVRVVELIGLFGLIDQEYRCGRSSEDVAKMLSRFIRRQVSAASPLSDRWAVAIVPVTLLLAKEGMLEQATDYLREVGLWLTQRYGNGVGLAIAAASPRDEVRQVVGRASRRDDSYLASVLLDLLAFCRIDRLYWFVRGECSRHNVRVLVIGTDDTKVQYILDGLGIEHEVNADYARELSDDWTDAAPHLKSAARERYLQRMGGSWDHLAVSATVRDRHFVSAWMSLVEDA